MNKIVSIITVFCLVACNQPGTSNKNASNNHPLVELANNIEYLTLRGDTVLSNESPSGIWYENYLDAKSNYEKDANLAENIIWYGRRTAYLGNYRAAIQIYSEGIEKHPADARFYRHRGHRYLSTRQYDLAIADFEKASKLIEGTDDKIEPDGIPNKSNTPVSTLHGNIWYHLALGYYLKNDLGNALRCYKACAKVSKNDDMIVSTNHWYYMALRRANQVELATKLVSQVSTDMHIIENTSYQGLCLLYNGSINAEDLQNTKSGVPSNDATLYGLGNWYLYNGNQEKAKSYFLKILANGNKASFGYLAAEADYFRIFEK